MHSSKAHPTMVWRGVLASQGMYVHVWEVLKQIEVHSGHTV